MNIWSFDALLPFCIEPVIAVPLLIICGVVFASVPAESARARFPLLPDAWIPRSDNLSPVTPVLIFPAVAPSTLTLVTVLKLFVLITVEAFLPKTISD